MGRAVIIILLTSILTFGIVSIQINRSSSESGSSISKYYRDLYTRNIANSMIEILRLKLNADSSFRVKNLTKEKLLGGDVFYKLVDTVINTTPLVKAFINVNYEGITRSTEAYFIIEKSSNSNLPPFFNYALFSGEEMHFNGGVNITNANNGLNANVHVNGNFSMNGNNKIEGFLTYTGMAWSNPPQALLTRIKPISNPTNLPVHFKTQEIKIPEFEPEKIKSKATEIYYGDKTFSGNITLGTLQNPKIIYVSGNLTISGNLSGYGIIISKGKTTINGNVTITSPNSDVSSIGIYSGDELVVNGNVTLNAQIFANDEVRFNGNCKVYGNVVAREEIVMNGNVTVYYKPANEVLTKPIWPNTNLESIVQVKTMYLYE